MRLLVVYLLADVVLANFKRSIRGPFVIANNKGSRMSLLMRESEPENIPKNLPLF